MRALREVAETLGRNTKEYALPALKIRNAPTLAAACSEMEGGNPTHIRYRPGIVRRIRDMCLVN